MKKMIKFPSIEQFRTVVSNVNRHFNFVGLDENGDTIYDPTLSKPVITFKGTVKLHGTNAGVSFDYGYDENSSEFWAQSRENIITPTPSKLIEIEFEDGTKQLFDESSVINGKTINEYKIGDTIFL
jgi:hypothetical protein